VQGDVTIHRIDSPLLETISERFAAEDSADIGYLDTLCRMLFDDSFHVDANDILKLVRREGSQQRCFGVMARRYMLDLEDLAPEMDTLYSLASSIIARQNARPGEFYLVTSSTQAEPVMIAGVRSKGPSGLPVLVTLWSVDAKNEARGMLSSEELSRCSEAILGERLHARRTPGLLKIWPPDHASHTTTK
jgi:hypothetical protein